MVKALLGRKLGMTQVFDSDGTRVPVTVLRVGPCTVAQVKTAETDKAAAVQIGVEERKRKNTPNPLIGHFEKAGTTPKRFLRDVEPDGDEMPEPGQEITVNIFDGVSHVDISGVSKGRGTAGVVRRYGFKGSPKSHGGRFGRSTGSIGASASPSRVVKGKKMPGHMGAAKVTVRNLEVVQILPEQDLLLVKGSVAGSKGGFVIVRKSARAPAASAAES